MQRQASLEGNLGCTCSRLVAQSIQTVAGQCYQIEYTASSLEDLKTLPKREAGQVLRKISRLEHGLHGNIKRLQNADFGFRLRMGNYRVLFDAVDGRILIQKIGNRKDVYD